MMKRLLVFAVVGLALVGGSYVGLRELTARAWEARRAKLVAMAESGPSARRPWEFAFEALGTRLTGEHHGTLADSAHRPYVAVGEGAPRALTQEERLWIEAAASELDGLEQLLAEVRRLDPTRANWGGKCATLLTLREVTVVLAARAWLALEEGDSASAAATYADALRLAAATDEGTSFAAMTRLACEWIVLDATRSALAFGLDARAARAELAPLLAAMVYDPERAERAIRRDLSYLARGDEPAECDSPAAALQWFAPVERALELARTPLERTPWAELPLVLEGAQAADAFAERDEALWHTGTWALHARAARARVASVALEVAEFGARVGRWPATLAELDSAAQEQRDELAGAELPYWTDGRRARIGPAAWGERVDRWERMDESPYLWELLGTWVSPSAPPARTN
jgi:hypothetical protein